ncbi:hypothetical protein [Planococcus plakortidis]|uniref:hypothetical protein n=1 Tax=Planococcus plakortidis TaxID=1038856 RepID=UPI003984B05C
MKSFSINDKVKVTSINYEHHKRVQIPTPLIIGRTGIVIKLSLTEENAYFIKFINGNVALLYADELE